MVSDSVCNTRLSLSLGLNDDQAIENDLKNKSLEKSADHLFPSLTLGLSLTEKTSVKSSDVKGGDSSNNMHGGQTSSVSAVSSFSNSSVKRERDVSVEEVEVEKVSPKVGEDQDEECPRKKLRLSKEQSLILEDSFKEHSTLNPKQKQALAKRLNLRPRQVEVWFQNRRARTKLKQTEVDYEILKKCCESLKEENRRLQKELQELKGMKLAGSLYMHLPAATLSMCPSCERIAGGGGSGGGGTNVNGGENSSKISFSIGPKPHFYSPFANPSAAC